jgi:hypothetical protein
MILWSYIIVYTVEPVQSDTLVFHILWNSTKMYGPKIFLLTKLKPEYSDILYNPTHFMVPWYVELDKFHCN